MKKMNKAVVAYDLETLPNPHISDEMANLFCKVGNLTDETKIKKKQAEFRSTMGKNPLLAIPCCCGYFSSEQDCGTIMLKDTSLEAEKTMLQEYFEKLAEFEILIGYNSIGFDSRILLLRACALGINIPFKFDRNKYKTTGNHIDLYIVLTDGAPYGQGKLDFFLNLFNLEGKTEGIDGSLVADYWNEGLHQDIANYCLQDCRQTLKLYEKVRHYFL